MTDLLPGFDLDDIRARFPALSRRDGNVVAAYLDGPGGTQVPLTVIEAMKRVLEQGVSNLSGGFASSRVANTVTAEARAAMADLLNCDRSEVVFGQNMTSLTFAMSRALAATWGPGDAVVLTTLDHDANFTPWSMAARDAGAEVRVAEFDAETGLLDPGAVIDLIDDDVRLVAVCWSSNAIGTVVDLEPIVEAARNAQSLTYIDAVHAAPHHLIDTKKLGCDLLAVSVYKFFGPHVGVMYGRRDLLTELDAYKVSPAPSDPPGKWETGTQSFEALAGVTAAVDHIASLGSDGATRRGSIEVAFEAIGLHERSLTTRFLGGIRSLPKVRLHGISEVSERRSPTLALEVDGVHPRDVARHFASRGIYVWAGHHYAVNVMDRLGVLDGGGLVRIGFTHYTHPDEVDRALEALSEM